MARLHHPTIVEVYDFLDEQEDEVCIVMELIDGTTLRKFLSDKVDGALPAEAAALITRKVFQGLAVAHEHGVVHRDVKPENILICKNGQIKLSDFGIAHLAGLDQMTVTGQILGSPAYMSPEHIEMAELDARADIFSAGTLLYELAVGSLPFHGKNPHQIIKRIVEGYYDQPLSVNPAIGHHVAAIITRCMQRDPAARFDDAGQVVEELERALAAVGIDDPEAELCRYFEDPQGWELEAKPRTVRRTLELGQAARKGHRLPEAMDHFNRVLALDPGNDKALDAVTGLSRRRRLRRSMERVAIGLAVTIAIAGGGGGVHLRSGGAGAREADLPEEADPGGGCDRGRRGKARACREPGRGHRAGARG